MKYTDERPVASCDTECFANYWSIGFKNVETGNKVIVEMYEGLPLDTKRIASIIRKYRITTFNGINYDMPMIALAMSGASNIDLKRASDDIIIGDLRPWQFEERFKVRMPEWLDNIDWMEVSPGSPTRPSLKQYAGRLHSRRMKDLPFEPDAWITEEDRPIMRTYLGNDLDVTAEGYLELKPQIMLRAEMSEQYGVDVRSKSDAQVAEAVIKAEIQAMTGKRIYKPDIQPGVFNYTPPKWVAFKTPEMRDMLTRLRAANFVVRSDGVVLEPAMLSDLVIRLGATEYSMGIGGLHSQEKSTSHYSDEFFTLRDRDVTSYYPQTILNSKLFPKHLGEAFLKVYRSIFTRRLAAKAKAISCKAKGDSEGATHWGNIAETLKIVLNGSFGKFGSPFSVLYSPDLMIQTTITGQLAILMLIESIEMAGMSVLSANTDGFVTKVPNDRYDEFFDIAIEWELATGYGTEEVLYKSLHSRDVNNYIALPMKGKPKTKGAFGSGGPGQKGASGMKKNPDCEIANDAAVAFLTDGTPVRETIDACKDVTKFVTIRKVKGGAEKDGVYLGKVIRFFYGLGEVGTINYVSNGNTVPSSEGATPCMDLPDECPDDIDRDWYEIEANAVLQDVGAPFVDPALDGRTGTVVARFSDQKTYHMLDLPSDKARCGKGRVSIRERWLEASDVPMGYRLCKSCREAEAL